MLVAGASLSLLAPVAAQASDVVNIEEMNSYSRSQAKSSRLDSNTFINEVSEDIANLKSRVDGLEVKQNEFEAGGFSDTTTLDGKVNFTVGALSYDGTGTDTVSNEATLFQYMWQGNLNTSFTGDDNLYVRLKTGNAGSWTKDKDHGTYLSSSKGNSNVLKVDTLQPNARAWLTTFDNVKFKSPVNPGDTLVFKLELLSPIRRGICHMKGSAFANKKLVTEGEFLAQIVKRDKI